MYARAWRERPDASQAHLRRVGTLTRGFEFETRDDWRARDVTWEEVRKLFDSDLEPTVAAVAADLAGVIDDRVLLSGIKTPTRKQQALLEMSSSLLMAMTAELRERKIIERGTKPVRQPDYTGTYFDLIVGVSAGIQVWAYVTPSGGKYNLFGAPDSLLLRVQGELSERRLIDAGFRMLEDQAGWKYYTLTFPLDYPNRPLDPQRLAVDLAQKVQAALAAANPPLAPRPAEPLN